MLWLDSGIEVRAPLTTIIGHIATDGHFFVTNGWPSPNKFTHFGVIQWFGLDENTHFYVEDPAGGTHFTCFTSTKVQILVLTKLLGQGAAMKLRRAVVFRC